MLPTLPKYLSCYINSCVVGLQNAVWYHLDYIEVLEMDCIYIVYFS